MTPTLGLGPSGLVLDGLPAHVPGRRVVLGLAGRAGAGKDTAAAWLVEHAGFVRLGFADGLRAELRARLPRTLVELAALCYDAGQLGAAPWTTDAEMVARLLAAKPPAARALCQEYGTDVRRAEDPDYWVARWHRQAATLARVVVPDVRFPNEAARIHALGGTVVLVSRPGRPALSGLLATHATETEVLDVDGTWTNASTIADLHGQVATWWAEQEASTHAPA